MNFKPSSPRLDPKTHSANSTDNQEGDSIRGKSIQPEPEPPVTEDTPPSPGISNPGAGANNESIEIAEDELHLENAMRWDQFRLRRQQRKLSREKFRQRLAASVQLRKRRESYQPKLEFPEELPITSYREQIIDLIRTRQVIVVCGETGSGKSTQLPKFCLQAGLGRQAMIGHTQPRRLAARSIATRLTEEMECSLGEQVGYQVRFGDQTGPETMVKLMTDGILLAETQSDRFLDQYDAIIIDEAHERSLNIDFLLAYLKRLLSKRSDLKVIITSATIDADRFAEHFADEMGPAPILNVEGRGYPVETRYLPWEDVADESRNHDLSLHVIEGIKNLSRSGSGDTLVFLPTERDIRLVSHRVAGHYKRMGMEGRVEVLPLYARLPQKDQQRIFHPSGNKQRLIFATNVAESSLTVPGIRYVIDSGTARISRYSPRSKIQRLPIEAVSRASADQRAGRCGRVGPGICVRLYSAEDYESRDAFTTPEIRRTNLASVVLQAKMLGFGALDSLPLLDVPRPESIREGVQTLLELGALDDRHELTAIGQSLGRMPLDPRIGRIILAAEEFGVLPEILPIAAAMEIPDPRVRPQENQQAADQAHEAFRDGESDFLSLLRLWKFYEQARADFSRSKLTRELRKRFLSPTRMREWSDTYRQLREIATNLGGNAASKSRRKLGAIQFAADDEKATLDKDRYAEVHRALLSGFLTGVATAGEKNVYLGARNLKLFLWPGSGVFDAKPKWIVAAELVETTKQYARTVARIQPQWIEQVAGHVLKSSYSDPHWSEKASGAFCYQRQSLFGLPVVVRRRVPLAPIDPSTARALLIQHGLVEQQLSTSARFVQHNRRLRQSFESLAAKTRRRDLVIDDYVVEQFYQDRLPEEVCDKGRLEKFSRSLNVPPWAGKYDDAASLSAALTTATAESATEECDSTTTCFMKPSDLLEIQADEISPDQFPDHLAIGATELPLHYRYEPGAEDDGVSLRIHKAAVAQISDDRLGWLVPGLLHGKIVAMIKSLPKRIRRNLVPAADVAEKVCDELMAVYGTVPFMPTVCEVLSRHAEMPIGESDFQSEKMQDHLQFLIAVVDDDGQTLAKSRSAEPLVKRFGGPTESTQSDDASGQDTEFPSEPMTSFAIDSLPTEVIRERGGVRVAQYPALLDQGDAVKVALFSDLASAETALAQGLTRLYAIAERKELRRQVRWLPDVESIRIRLAGAVSAKTFEPSMIDLLARIAFVENQKLARCQADFEAARVNRSERISVATQELAIWLGKFAEAYLTMRGELESLSRSQFPIAGQDVDQQVQWLVHPQFLSTTPWQWLKHYPRYLQAISYRLDKLRSGAVSRDESAIETVAGLWSRYSQRYEDHQWSAAARSGDEFRWLIEELRVSLFAQPLGTAVKVSPKRCEKWFSRKGP